MATVNLYLTDPKAKKQTRIYARIVDGRVKDENGKIFRMKFSSSISVHPKHWNKKHQHVTSQNTNAVEYNKQLNGISATKDEVATLGFRQKVFNAYLEAKANGIEVTKDYLQREVYPKAVKEYTFWEVWDLYIASKTGSFNSRSTSKFNTLKGHLQAFEEQRQPLSLRTSMIQP